MMKKRFYVLFIFMTLILTLGIFSGFSLNIKKRVLADEFVNVKSKSAILMDFNSHTVVYEHNAKEHLPIASMCKIMTLLLCFEALDDGIIGMDEEIVVSDTAAGMGGSQVFLEANASYKVHELLKSIVVASANDACVAMAEKLYGSESSFVTQMNNRAAELNMNDTVFTNCTGLPKAGQYSCARDVSVMFSELLKHKEYYEFSSIWMDEITHPKGRKTEISNTNKLIRFYHGCDSGKTGYTSEAGHCLAASAIRDGMRLVCVVISAPDSKTRFAEVSSMFNKGFAEYTNKLLIDSSKPLDLTVEVPDGKKDTVSVVAARSVYLFSSKHVQRSVEIDFQPSENLKAPVYKGDIVGKLIVYENGIEIDSVDVVSVEDILEKTYFDYIKDIMRDWAII